MLEAFFFNPSSHLACPFNQTCISVFTGRISIDGTLSTVSHTSSAVNRRRFVVSRGSSAVDPIRSTISWRSTTVDRTLSAVSWRSSAVDWMLYVISRRSSTADWGIFLVYRIIFFIDWGSVGADNDPPFYQRSIITDRSPVGADNDPPFPSALPIHSTFSLLSAPTIRPGFTLSQPPKKLPQPMWGSSYR